MTKENLGILIVDPVNCFFKDGSLPVPKAEEIIKPINNLVRAANLNGTPVYVVREAHPSQTSHFEKWPVHGVKGTEGAMIHPELEIPEAKLFAKGANPNEDGYSGFDGVSEIDESISLEQALRADGITVIAICGLATDYCDKATALDSQKFGFRTLLIEDAVRAVNVKPWDGECAISEMKSAGVEITDTKRLIASLSK